MNRSGWTLVELMMTVTILAILGLGVPKLMLQFIRFRQLQMARVEIQRDARNCLDQINRFLRQAQAATVSIDQLSGQPPYSRISFVSEAGQSMQYFQQGNKLFHVAQSTIAITNNLRYIGFTYPRSEDPTLLSVSITMEKATYEGGTKALELSIEKVRVMNN